MVHNARGNRHVLRLLDQIIVEHLRAPFDVIHTAWSVRANLTAIVAAKMLRVPVPLYLGAGELAALSDTERFGRQLSLRGTADLWARHHGRQLHRIKAMILELRNAGD